MLLKKAQMCDCDVSALQPRAPCSLVPRGSGDSGRMAWLQACRFVASRYIDAVLHFGTLLESAFHRPSILVTQEESSQDQQAIFDSVCGDSIRRRVEFPGGGKQQNGDLE